MKRIIIIEDDGQPGINISSYQGLTDFNQAYDPCANCSQNPKNNPYASGVCCCALPDLYNKRYGPTTTSYRYYTTSSFDNIDLQQLTNTDFNLYHFNK